MPLTAKRVSVPRPKNKIVRSRSSVFPISIPEMPASIFPITSQEDLVKKISRLFLAPLPARGRRKYSAPLPPGITNSKSSAEQSGED